MKKQPFIHDSSVIDNGAKIGDETKIWHFCHVSKNSQIGSRCSLGQNVFIGENVKIGNHVKIQNNVSVYQGVELEDYVFCGPSMVFTNDINPRSKFPKGSEKFLKTKVKEGATIGANATIVCGITIGKNSFIGSGSVVTKDIPDYALVFGNPGKIKAWMCECGEKLNFKTNSITCKNCNRKYHKISEGKIEQE